MKIGNLEILSAKARTDILAPSVADAIAQLPDSGGIGVVPIDPDVSDTAAFCTRYDVTADQCANCVVLEARRADRTWFAACVILGTTRADVNGLARRTLDARKASFASMEKAVALTGMEYGAITPIGLPSDWPILIDKAVADSPQVIIGSGLRKSKLVVTGSFLASLPNAKVFDGLGISAAQ